MEGDLDRRIAWRARWFCGNLGPTVRCRTRSSDSVHVDVHVDDTGHWWAESRFIGHNPTLMTSGDEMQSGAHDLPAGAQDDHFIAEVKCYTGIEARLTRVDYVRLGPPGKNTKTWQRHHQVNGTVYPGQLIARRHDGGLYRVLDCYESDHDDPECPCYRWFCEPVTAEATAAQRRSKRALDDGVENSPKKRPTSA